MRDAIPAKQVFLGTLRAPDVHKTIVNTSFRKMKLKGGVVSGLYTRVLPNAAFDYELTSTNE
jgi:hypothetical protein